MCSDVSDLKKGLTDDVERVARWIEAINTFFKHW